MQPSRVTVEPGPQGSQSEAVTHFHQLYYDSMDLTWKNTYWMGTRVAKCPLDLWVYQEIVWETRPDLVVECGSAYGGSALFLASLFDHIGAGSVCTIDIAEVPDRPVHPRIRYLSGSSTDPDIVVRVERLAASADRVMVILDSDHSCEHVANELELYAGLVTPTCYLIVEDTNLNGNPIVVPGLGPGPGEAVAAFLERNRGFEVDHTREKLLLTFNPGGYLRRR
jgi:cephalosporin hydroxylase